MENLFASVMEKIKGVKADRAVEMYYFAGGEEVDEFSNWAAEHGGVVSNTGDSFTLAFQKMGLNTSVSGTAPGWIIHGEDKSFEFIPSKV